jgi:glycosyltransferase involved in cell wall biosynthesis
LAVIFDALEERWPSMDLVAEMLLVHLQTEHSDRFESLPFRPWFFGLFEKLPGLERATAWNADRAVTRFLTYPAQLAARRSEFDLFHVADHSYSQLAHVLPAERTGVYCHDLDAFAPVLKPDSRSGGWRKTMASIQLKGLQRAAVVFYSTQQIRREIEEAGILDPDRIVHAPYGVGPEFFGPEFEQLPAAVQGAPYLLHVGGTMARKRLDVLFEVFAAVRQRFPELILVQQGARLLPEHKAMITQLGIADAIIQPPRLSRSSLAALYHGAELVLVPSEREGFGLPVLEALAAGAAVVASDIPPFREVAGDAVSYCAVAQIETWTKTVISLLEHPSSRPAATVRRSVADRYTWTSHATVVAKTYARLIA